MGSGSKKTKKKLMGDYVTSQEEDEAFVWCIRNNIKISPRAASRGNPTEWHIVIESQGRTHMSPETYGPGDVWIKLHEFYKYYYDKYRKRV